MSKNKNKNKKEKVVYYDDGSTLSDMSEVGGIYGRKIGRSSGSEQREKRYYRPRSSFSDKAKTYFEAVKLMIKPMLIVLIAISVVFLILFLISSLR